MAKVFENNVDMIGCRKKNELTERIDRKCVDGIV